MIAQGLTVFEYTATNLSPGLVYSFQVMGRNKQYWGDPTAALPILAAQEPAMPDPPTTELVEYNVVVSWEAPFDSGSPMTGYRIFLRKAD
jgi:hypothetical protein